MRLENYIMEQDINTSTVADIFSEQAQAEFNVALAIADSYAKEVAIVEYYYAEGTLLDSATNKGVDESKLKKALLFIPRFFNAIFTRFIALFKKKDVVAAKKLVENIPDEVKSDVLVPMTEAEFRECMKAIDGAMTLLLGHAGAADTTSGRGGKGGSRGIVGKLSDYCERLYNGDVTNHKQMELDPNTIKSIELLEKFNLSKIIEKHRAKYNEIARQMAAEESKTKLQWKRDMEAETKKSNAQYKEDQLLAPEGEWLGKMPNKKTINVDQPVGGDQFASVAEWEQMINKLDDLRKTLIQFKKDADETIKDLEAAIKHDEDAKAEKQRPELRNALSEAVSLCNRVNKAVIHFCDEIERVIGKEMGIINEVAHVKDFDIKRKGFMSNYDATWAGGKGSSATYSGSYSDSYSNGKTNKARRANTIPDEYYNAKADSWGRDAAWNK